MTIVKSAKKMTVVSSTKTNIVRSARTTMSVV